MRLAPLTLSVTQAEQQSEAFSQWCTANSRGGLKSKTLEPFSFTVGYTRSFVLLPVPLGCLRRPRRPWTHTPHVHVHVTLTMVGATWFTSSPCLYALLPLSVLEHYLCDQHTHTHTHHFLPPDLVIPVSYDKNDSRLAIPGSFTFIIPSPCLKVTY